MASNKSKAVPSTGGKTPDPWIARLYELREYQTGWSAADGYDARSLSAAQRGAITRAWNKQSVFFNVWQRPDALRVVRATARSAKGLAALHAALPVDPRAYPSRWKPNLVLAGVAPGTAAIRLDPKTGGIVQIAPTITVRAPDGRFRFRVSAPHSVSIPIDPMVMALDPFRVAADVLAAHPNAAGFTVGNGRGWVNDQSGRVFDSWYFFNDPREDMEMRVQELGSIIAKLLHRYGAQIGGKGSDDPENDEPEIDDLYPDADIDLRPRAKGSNYFKHWVTGMVAHYIPEATPEIYSAFQDYARAESRRKRNYKDRARRATYAKAKGRK